MNREKRTITVRRMVAYLYTSMYLSFGWRLEEAAVSVSSPIYTELCFSRDKNIRDSAGAQSLWRQFDAAVGEIEAQERVQAGCTRTAVLFGITGIALLVAAFLVSRLLAATVLRTVLIWTGSAICASTFLFYCAIYKRRADEFAEHLCRNYQTIYEISREATALTIQAGRG